MDLVSNLPILALCPCDDTSVPKHGYIITATGQRTADFGSCKYGAALIATLLMECYITECDAVKLTTALAREFPEECKEADNISIEHTSSNILKGHLVPRIKLYISA
jgi:hypothetical protein